MRKTLPTALRLLDPLFQVRTVPLSLLALCFLCYGLFIPRLGFYWDGWYKIWLYHSLGFPGLREFFPSNRPLAFWISRLTMPLFGESSVHWHIFALIARWASAVAMWWAMRGLWPRRRREVAGMAFLFAVYPGFSQQPIALVYGPNTFVPLIFFMVSFGAMIWAQRTPSLFWPLTVFALLSMATSMTLIEYFTGLELLRPVLLWMILRERTPDAKRRLRLTLANWTPYLVGAGIVIVWRLFLLKTIQATSQQTAMAAFLASPLRDLKTRLGYAITDTVKSGMLAWTQTVDNDILNFHGYSAWVALALTLTAATGVALYLSRLKTGGDRTVSDDTTAQSRWSREAVIVGFLAIILAGLPIWAVNRHVTLLDADDRYTIPAMLGASILLATVIEIAIRTRRQKIIVLGIVVGLAVGFHVRNSNRYRLDWLAQQSLFWQLSWRVPNLKPGTSLLTVDPPLLFSGDYSLSAPLNFVYNPQHASTELNYWLFNLSERPIRLERDTELKREIGPLSFAGSTSKSLVFWFSPPGCLRILDPGRDEVPGLPPLARAARDVSRLDLIVTDMRSNARPPAEIFGPEPERGWCYYFERAELARHRGDLHEVVRISDEVSQRRLKPGDPTEWLPFVEAYIGVSRYEDARKLAQLALQDVLTRPALCGLLNRIEVRDSVDQYHKAFIDDMKMSMACPVP